MEIGTFRKWLVEHGCRIDTDEHPRGHQGHGEVTVHREGRKARIPLGSARHAIDSRMVERVCRDLGLDPAELPGPKSRV